MIIQPSTKKLKLSLSAEDGMIKPRVKGKEQDGKRPHLTKDTAQQAGDDRRLREGRV